VHTAGKRKGAVLIVVLGVLAVLALLATTFATLQATEKQVARNYLDTVRAKMLAQSGVQSAEAQLRSYFPFRYFNNVANPNAPIPWKFWGVDSAPWETREPNPADKLEDATNPSFAIENEVIQDPTDANVVPRLIMIEGRNRGLSGYMGTGSYDALHGDNYSLKVTDLSGHIYVNDGLDGGPNGSVTQNLRRILNILGTVLGTAGLGDQIVNNRPTSGYRSPQDLLAALGYNDSLFQRVRQHVTVYAWVDNNCVNPVPLSASVAAVIQKDTKVQYYRGTPPVYRFQSSKDAVGNDITQGGFDLIRNQSLPQARENPSVCVYGMDCLNPQWIEIVNRAPVNVNSATREVLVALLTDVKGFFLGDRRRNNPRWAGDLYLSFKQQNSFSPAGVEGDEVGFLMETVPIVGPGGTASTGISGYDIADEIIACRSRKAGKYGNYTQGIPDTQAFSGPFRNWAQFNAFVDYLVKVGLIVDNRPGLNMDYPEEVQDSAGYNDSMVESPYQKDNASKAVADAIKANFNPNCHLNELNPDENLYLRVDKTDLEVMSTEFTFLPTGYFEVESLGRVLRPKDPNTKDCYFGDNDLVAQAKVTATYKLYDMYRETNQKQFYAGILPARTGSSVTNNNMSLEIGPEPDNGKLPGNFNGSSFDPGDPDNEWDGYLALPTIGGDGHSAGNKAKNTLVTTIARGSSPQYNSVLHAHYQWDHDAHYSKLDPHEIASKDNADENVSNYPSQVAGQDMPFKRPNNPASGVNNGQAAPLCRLAKSFRQTMAASGTMTSPPLQMFAPSDLHIDGAYVERHSAPAYYAYQGTNALLTLFGGNAKAQGMFAFWWKPNYYPNLTGKIRAMLDFSRYHDPCGQSVNIWPFAIWNYPCHYNPALSEGMHPNPNGGSSWGPAYWHNNQGYFEPSSLAWGSKAWHDVSTGHNFGNMTRSLNHLDHTSNPGCTGQPNILKGHSWIHTAVEFQLNGNDPTNAFSSKMFVNGYPGIVGSTALTNKVPYNFYTMTTWAAGWTILDQWDKHSGGESNQLRLGATSKIANNAIQTGKTYPDGTVGVPGAYKGNYSGDHTIDEFYAWDIPNDSYAINLWIQGRYYKPLGSKAGTMNSGEGLFTSQAISFITANPRTAAPPSNVPTPGGTGGAPSSVPVIPPQIRILGLSWTWYGDDLDPVTGLQTLYDHGGQYGVAAANVMPQVLCGIIDGSQTYGPFSNDGFSTVQAPDGSIPVIQDPKNVKYYVQFALPQATAATILLSTPVVDDITLYYDDSRTHLLSYALDNRSF
jgi:hypothetical protein